MSKERKFTRREVLIGGLGGLIASVFTLPLINSENTLRVICSFGPNLRTDTKTENPNDYPFDAIVILGAGIEKTEKGEKQNLYSKMRLIAGATAFRDHLAPKLVLIGEPSDKRPSISEAYLERKYQKQEGNFGKIPENEIIPKDNSFNTASDLKAVAELIKQNGWKRVAIVTNDFHIQRVMLLAQNFGIDAQAISAEEELKKRDPRFAKVIENIYSSGEMRLITGKEFLEVLELIWDPNADIPTFLAKLRPS